MKRIPIILLMLQLCICQAAAQDDYDNFVNSIKKEYASFRDQANKEYADFMEKAWKSYGIKRSAEKPKKEDVPIKYDKEKDEEGEKVIEAEVIPFKEDPKPQPQPIEPIKENIQAPKADTFVYYGTPMSVRWGNAEKFKLAGTNEKALAKAYRELTGSAYNNLLHDCLELRKKYTLCDWAYYKMLEILAGTICGKGTNEAVFLQGVLFHQSGYMMRFALNPDDKSLHLLVRIDGVAYDSGYTSVGGKIFFLLDGSKLKNLQVCEASYPGEKEMTFLIPKLPKLDVELSKERQIISRFVNVEAKIAVNKNMINFFNDYPSTYNNQDIMTSWAFYANTPVTKEVRENMYPQLKERFGNATPLMAANLLLNWVQMGFEYAIDQKVWGGERAFFAEESLYYPLCDCEDRAILYSHLVRDLLGLDVLLVYYPEHLYTAVCFNEDVKGDYFMVDGRKFTVADPTYYMANVGKTMNRMDNSKAKVILLKK